MSHATTRFALALALVGVTACGDLADKAPVDGAASLTDVALTSAKADSPNAAGALSWDVTVSDTVSNRFDVWTLTVADGDVFFLDLATRASGDLFLALFAAPTDGGDAELVAVNDDCYDGTLNACLNVAALEPGEYWVIATTYAYVAGVRGARRAVDYDLTAWCQREDGPCGGGVPTDQVCGTRGAAPCPEGTYCDWPDDMCGALDGPGVCVARPEACITIYDPVCGCDGHTYGNGCSAASHGVDVAYDGECEDGGQGVGETCGGIATLACNAGLECDYSGNVGCFIADIGGACIDASEPRACTMEYAPVCGCDGVTYSNDCFRRDALVPLDPTGDACAD